MKQTAISFVLFYLRCWARLAQLIHRPRIVGIAGSVGKSSTRNAVEAMLKERFRVLVVHGNSETGVPLGILGITPHGYSPLHYALMCLQAPLHIFSLVDVDVLIVEMGIDDPLPPKNMSYLLRIVRPDIAVSLNISATHTMQFEKILNSEQKKLSAPARLEMILQRMAEEDTKIITQSGCRVGIYNADDTYIQKEIKRYATQQQRAQLLAFGTQSSNEIYYSDYHVTLDGTVCTFIVRDVPEPITVAIKNAVLPEVYREVFAAAILVGRALQMKPEEIRTALQKNFSVPKGRVSVFAGVHDSTILDSSYNASRAALIPFIDLLNRLGQQDARPRVLILGDMRELGESSGIEHAAVAEYLREKVEYLYCVGPLTKKYVVPIAEHAGLKEVRWFRTSRDLGSYLQEHLPQQALVLVKGSQNEIFLEEAIKMLLASSEDVKKLCRQEPYWTTIKEKYFASLR